MTGLRKAALVAITLLVAAASLTSFAESYRALFLWANHHGLHRIWAYAWPLQIDVFIAVGELALLVGLADSWPARSRAAAWSVTVLGLAVSVAGNIGHIAGHDIASRATAAVPPLAAAAALAVGLGVLKRVAGGHGAVPADPTDRLTDLASQVAAGLAVLGSELRSPMTVPADTSGDRHAARSGNGAGTVERTGPGATARTGTRAIEKPVRKPLPGPVRKQPADRSGTRSTNRSGAAKANRSADEDAEREFAAEIAAGQVPSLYQIRSRFHVGNERAKVLRQHIARQALTT